MDSETIAKLVGAVGWVVVIVLAVLKLDGHVNLDWVWIAAPIWGPVALILVGILLLLVWHCIKTLCTHPK